MNRASFSLLFAVTFFILRTGLLAGPSSEQALYDKLRKAVFSGRKVDLAVKLARLRTGKARELLLELLKSPDYSFRKAAVAGLFELHDKSVGPALLDIMLNDIILDDQVAGGFAGHFDTFFPLLKERYPSLYDNEDGRAKIIDIMGQAGKPAGVGFLKSIIDDRASPDRLLAFKVLTEKASKGVDVDYVKKFEDDAQLKELVFAFLVKHGKALEGLSAEYFTRIREATFLSEKRRLACEMVRKDRGGAVKALKRLLDSSASWDREAAVAGLFELKDPSVGGILARVMLEDYSLRNEVARGFRESPDRYLDQLIAAYRANSEDSTYRTLVIGIAGASSDARALEFLKDIVDRGNENDASTAFAELAANHEGCRKFILDHIDDKRFRREGLAFFVKFGTKDDLKIFLDVFKNDEELKFKLAAMPGIVKYADRDLRCKTYLDILKGRDEALARTAMIVFCKERCPIVMNALVELTYSAASQRTRMLAAKTLCTYDEKATIPALVHVLDEKYEARPPSLTAALFSPISLGLTSLGDYLSRKYDKKSFQRQKKEIRVRLFELTGARPGDSHDAWLEWAVLHGHTVEGRNIIQLLFSAFPDRRMKAFSAAARLLGHKDLRDLERAVGHACIENPVEFSTAVAALLMKAGYLKDAVNSAKCQ